MCALWAVLQVDCPLVTARGQELWINRWVSRKCRMGPIRFLSLQSWLILQHYFMLRTTIDSTQDIELFLVWDFGFFHGNHKWKTLALFFFCQIFGERKKERTVCVFLWPEHVLIEKCRVKSILFQARDFQSNLQMVWTERSQSVCI